MSNYKDDIRDDEIRIIGSQSRKTLLEEERISRMGYPASQAAPDMPPEPSGRKKKPLWPTLLALLILLGLVLFFLWSKEKPEDPNDGLFENIPEVVKPNEIKSLGIETEASFTEKLDTVINDVVLSLYIPHNATPKLTLGVPDRNDESIIFAAQAADIRRDNRKILGAFVLEGEPLAWGLSKKGFCAIINGVITVGVSENSPLFEEATEKGGYFFRQYPLVDNGVLVENEPKNKTMRKALCSRAGQVFIAVSETDESFHDFSQALVDLGVENAVYLVGSHSSFGWYIDADGEKTLFAPDVHREAYKNESYIIWRL